MTQIICPRMSLYELQWGRWASPKKRKRKVLSKKNTGRIRYYIHVGKVFRGLKFELMFDNPFAVRRQLVIFEIVLLYITAWLVVYEKEKGGG